MKEKKLADFVKNDPTVLDFLNRLEIPLGFGDKTVGQICEEYNIDYYFFSELIQLIMKKYEFNPKYIDKFEIKLTVKYLRNSHKSYLTDYLQKIEKDIEQLSLLEYDRKKDCDVLNNYFLEYKLEFNNHLLYEDDDIFPYILELEKAYHSGKPSNELLQRIKGNKIINYVKKHDSLDEKLNDLKNLLIKYFKPFRERFLVISLLKTMYELEEDLKLHDLIENQILFMQAKKIEDNIILAQFKQ